MESCFAFISRRWLLRPPPATPDGIHNEAVSEAVTLSLFFTEPLVRAYLFVISCALFDAQVLRVSKDDILLASSWLASLSAKILQPLRPVLWHTFMNRFLWKAPFEAQTVYELLFSSVVLKSLAFVILVVLQFSYLRRLAVGFSRADLDAFCYRTFVRATPCTKGRVPTAKPSESSVAKRLNAFLKFCGCPPFAESGNQAEQTGNESGTFPSGSGGDVADPSFRTRMTDQQKVGVYVQPSRMRADQMPANPLCELLLGQTAVVTGASQGLGRETAVQLAKWGADVYIGIRNWNNQMSVTEALAIDVKDSPTTVCSFVNKVVYTVFILPVFSLVALPKTVFRYLFPASPMPSSQSPPFNIFGKQEKRALAYVKRLHVHELELNNPSSVHSFAAWVLAETGGRVDILVNNAGVKGAPSPRVVNFNGNNFELQFVSNHLGHFLLTHLLLPAIKKAALTKPPSAIKDSSTILEQFKDATGPGRGRIINVSSCLHAKHSPNFSLLDVTCDQETAVAAAAYIAAAEAAQHEDAGQHSQLEQQGQREGELTKPLLKQARYFKVKNYTAEEAYRYSKLANIWFTKELQKRVLQDANATDGTNVAASANAITKNLSDKNNERSTASSCVGVYAAHPGVVMTRLCRHRFGRMRELENLYRALGSYTVAKDSAAGAATQLFLCVAPKEMLNWGGFYSEGAPGWVEARALNRKEQRRLWLLSEFACMMNSCSSDAHVDATVKPVVTAGQFEPTA